MFCVMFMTACTTPDPKFSDVPPELFDCLYWPNELPEGYNEIDYGEWVLEGRASWESCHGNMESLKSFAKPKG